MVFQPHSQSTKGSIPSVTPIPKNVFGTKTIKRPAYSFIEGVLYFLGYVIFIGWITSTPLQKNWWKKWKYEQPTELLIEVSIPVVPHLWINLILIYAVPISWFENQLYYITCLLSLYSASTIVLYNAWKVRVYLTQKYGLPLYSFLGAEAMHNL